MSAYLHVRLRKSTSEIVLEFFSFFTFIKFFMKTLMNRIIYCQNVRLDCLPIRCENCTLGLSAFIRLAYFV